MSRHILVFIYISGSFLGMTGVFLYWLSSKKTAFKDNAEFIRLKKFMVSTCLIGLVSFFTFYSQYIIFQNPSHTAFRILDYLFWVCFIFYWLDYLDSMVEGNYLRKFKNLVKFGCLCFIVTWIFTTSHIWDISFTVMNYSSRILISILDFLFCLLSLFVVSVYVVLVQKQVENKLSGLYVFAVSTVLAVYAIWEFLNYIRLFAGLSTPKAWELDPFNATAFFLFFTNLITLFYVYHNDFSSCFLAEREIQVITESMDTEENTCSEIGETACSASAAAEDIANEHNLTPREKEVMEYVRKGFNNAEIADELFISQNTVKHHIYNLFRKLHVSNRVELLCLLQEHYS